MFFLIILRLLDMLDKHCFLILTHKSIDHIYTYAEYYKNCNFYVHVDKKIDINCIKSKELKNVYFIDDANRVDVNWASFSMVQATLNLMKFALKHDSKNGFFHLISGDDVIFESFDRIKFDINKIYIECYESPRQRYRVRFNTMHAGTRIQRNIIGKTLTILYKLLDRLLLTSEKCYFGSQWFSISRSDLEIIIFSNIDQEINFFKNKLCPDEHFFQYLILKNGLKNKVANENKRFIVFDEKYQKGSSPIFLNFETLKENNNKSYWFSRKVLPNDIIKFLQMRGID